MEAISRIFIPGSEWIYFKIYTGNKTADRILSDCIFPIVNKLYRQKLCKKWFFIRYSDPETHLRIRILMKDEQYSGEIMNLFFRNLNKYGKDNLIWKIQLDTYNRELERYGNTLIEEAESIFHVDSECTLSLLKKLNETKNENYRWMIALTMIDSLLSDFSFDIEKKQALMKFTSESFKSEFGFNQHNAKQFNTKFRENKSIVESVLNHTISDESFLSLSKPIELRSKKLLPIIEKLTVKLKKDKIGITLDSLLTSYIHMMFNRLFRSKNRVHELILYDFMYRYYTSEIAKQKYNVVNKQ